MEQEVAGAGDHEHADDLRQLAHPVAERLHDLARRRPDRHRGQRLHVATERAEVDVRVVAADHAFAAQRAHALRGRRRRDVDRGREVAVARPCIVLQNAQNRPVHRIKLHHLASQPLIVRIIAPLAARLL